MTSKYEVIEDIKKQIKRTGFPAVKLLDVYGISKSTYYGWLDKNGKLKPPVDKTIKNYRQVLPDEEQAIIEFRKSHPDVGYRKLAWMMVDADIVYLSESAVYKILANNNMLQGWNRENNDESKNEYENKPKHIHHHWHIDIAYIKIGSIFYFLIMLLDGYSRYLLNWELMPDMTSYSVEMFVQTTKDKYPNARPILISDNGSQFISLDFKRLASSLQINQVFTRRNHPQTNGKIERLNQTVKNEAIRKECPLSYQETCDVLNNYAYIYNYQRLHAGIKYLRPADMFFGRGEKILNERRQKIILARKQRIEKNQLSKCVS